MKTSEDVLNAFLLTLRKQEKQLLQDIESAREGLAAVRALIAKEEARTKVSDANASA